MRKAEALLFFALQSLFMTADTPTVGAAGTEVIHVSTALDHITVLEFGETVSMVAAGSPAFQVERHDDKILVKPLRTGVSTDLVVWTPSRRLIYELEAPGEVANMNFAVDSRKMVVKEAAQTASRSEDVVESAMARAFLAAIPIDSGRVHESRDGITVRFEHLLLSKRYVYLHYSMVNRGTRTYCPGTPAVEGLVSGRGRPSPISSRRSQLKDEDVKKLGKAVRVAISSAMVEMSASEIKPGATAEGIVALPQQFESGSVLDLTFSYNGKQSVHAALVL